MSTHRQSDRDVFWTISLAWIEYREPYEPPATRHPDPKHRPALHYGRTLKYETYVEAKAACDRLRQRTDSWLPNVGHDPAVSEPTPTARKVRS